MLKQNVLRKNHQFQLVINKKKQVVTEAIVLYHLNNNTHLRIGISISKKFANAVKRNRYRRQVRHILDNLNVWNKYKKDVVLILRKPFLKMDYKRQTKAIKTALERLGNEKQ